MTGSGRGALVAAMVWAAIGCGGRAAAPVAPAPAASSASVACAAEPAGLAPLLHPGALVIFGEVHGTVETPAFVANAACHAARIGAVAVGMEIPRDLQPQLDRFLDSAAGPDDVSALTRGAHWLLQDGTASQALVDLIGRVRELRRAGGNIRLFFFDMAEGEAGDRDRLMADHIAAEVDRNTGGITLILTGNLHAKTDSERWMSWHIAQRHPELVTLNVGYPGGAAYVCMMGGTCGIHRGMRGKDRGSAPFVERLAMPDDSGYSGVFYLGAPVSPSPPIKPDGPIKEL